MALGSGWPSLLRPKKLPKPAIKRTISPGDGGAGEACSAGPRSGWPAIPRIERRATRRVRAVAAPGDQVQDAPDDDRVDRQGTLHAFQRARLHGVHRRPDFKIRRKISIPAKQKSRTASLDLHAGRPRQSGFPGISQDRRLSVPASRQVWLCLNAMTRFDRSTKTKIYK